MTMREPSTTSGPPAVRDHTTKPAGLIPKHVQTWVVLGIAVAMTGVIALSGPPRSPERPEPKRTLVALEPNDARIQEYQKRIDDEARRLAGARAELEIAKRALGVAPETGQGEAGRAGGGRTGRPTQPQEVSSSLAL